MNKTEKKPKKWLKILSDVLFMVLLVIIAFFAVIAITSRVTGGKIGNHQYLVVVSSSMDGEEQKEYDIKTIPIKSLIKVECVPDKEDEQASFYSSLKVGDVLTFNYLDLGNATITHRIIEVNVLKDNVYQYIVKGDAVENDTQTLYSDGRTGEIIGKVVSTNGFIGHIYYFINQPIGMVAVIIIPASLLCIYEIGKVIYLLMDDRKKKKAQAIENEARKKDEEIEMLKKKLAEKEEAEKNQNNPD